VQVLGNRLHAVAHRLQLGELVRRDPEAEDVDGLRLLAEPARELDRDEDARVAGDLQDARDRVVVGDRHEVHAARQRELQDLPRRRRALGKSERSLDPELRQLRSGRVAVQVGPARARGHASQIPPVCRAFCERPANMM
jgi:hypothetical protein